MTMQYLQSIPEDLYFFVEWLWKNGGWWSAIGGVSFLLLIGMKMHPGHQRKG